MVSAAQNACINSMICRLGEENILLPRGRNSLVMDELNAFLGLEQTLE
jgi:hypothetical protein